MSTVLDIGHGSWYDSEVLERWLRITVAASNCSRWSPQIYLRAIDELVDAKTHKPVGYANPLDISDIGGTRTNLLGDKYSPETTRRDGTVDMEFDGVMGAGTRLLYVGLGNISDMGTEKCQVTHRYFGVGINTSSSRQLTRNQPYALLASVSVSDKGTLVIDFDLDHRDQWRPEIEKVTADQNKILCKRYALQCSTTAPGAPAP